MWFSNHDELSKVSILKQFLFIDENHRKNVEYSIYVLNKETLN